MLHYKRVTHKEISAFTCDRCKKHVVKKLHDFAFEEGHLIDFVAGFNSVFGDGNRVECDLCQECLQDLIKDFCRVSEYTL